MINQDDLRKIKNETEEFFQKIAKDNFAVSEAAPLFSNNNPSDGSDKNIVEVLIKMDDPGWMIGRDGRTLFDAEKILKMILNKKLGKFFYLSIDINGYKKEKTEHLKRIANNAAEEVALIQREKTLPPMAAYERKIIHEELSQRKDVSTKSRDDSSGRHIIIIPL